MDLPRSNYELTKTFRSATAPRVSEFNGEYLVDMLTVLPSLKRFSHRKVIYNDNGRVLGHNVLFNKIWGHFFIEEDVCRDVDSVKVAVINYNRIENLFFINRVRDYVRCVEKEILYIGRFNYLLFGKLHFLGYFSLEKVK